MAAGRERWQEDCLQTVLLFIKPVSGQKRFCDRPGRSVGGIMEYLVTAEEMKRYDRITVQEIGIPSMVLMERAALAVMEEILAYTQGQEAQYCRRLSDGGFWENTRPGACPDRTVLILAGCGNNGGDGLALARLLSEKGFDVEVTVCGNPAKATPEWKLQADLLRHYPVKFAVDSALSGRKPSGGEYTVLVDALFGVGLSREITGTYAEQIAAFNSLRGYKIALDLPSGVHSDDGRVMGCAVEADLTVSLGLEKRGMYLYPGAAYCGRIRNKEIGIGKQAFRDKEPQMFCYTEGLEKLLPPRRKDGNKGTFGKVLLAAGTLNMAGAALLAARSCYRSGAGMVKVLSPECNRLILQAAVPEALFRAVGAAGDTGLSGETFACGASVCETVTDDSYAQALAADLEWADVLAIGPGLGTDKRASSLLKCFLRQSDKPMVIDADGLNLLAGDPGLWKELAARTAGGRKVILTPHLGELSRLSGESVGEIKSHLAESVLGLAERLGCVVVGKDARTIVGCPGGPLCLNRTGNSGMGTAGSGDVLTGILAGLLAQGMEAFEAAAVGVYWHGLAGDAAAEASGEYAVTASDIIAHMVW